MAHFIVQTYLLFKEHNAVDNIPIPLNIMNMLSSSIIHSNTVVAISKKKQLKQIRKIIFMNSDPSATKIWPVEATATAVGLQKWLASFPGTNASPRTVQFE
jgi:hypothetical protein